MSEVKVAIIDHVGLKAGMECYDIELYFALKKADCTSIVYSNFPTPASDENIFSVFKFRIRENIFSFLKVLRVYFALKREMEVRGIDRCILHAFRFGMAEWIIMNVIKKMSIKIYLIVHDSDSLLGNSSSRKWRSKIFQMSEKLIVHNKYCYRELMESLDREEKNKLAIIPHGNFISSVEHKTDVKKMKRKFEFEFNRKFLLFFGQIKKSKGLDLLLEALAMTDASIELIIAGRMRKHSFAEYQTLIEKYALERRVKLFVQYISPAMRDILFQISDAVVIPYRKVFQSGVMIMAMSYNKAIIASDLPANMEMITHEQNGILFQSGNREELAEAINRVMKNDRERGEIAESGFQYVNAKHDWNEIAKQWIKLFTS